MTRSWHCVVLPVLYLCWICNLAGARPELRVEDAVADSPYKLSVAEYHLVDAISELLEGKDIVGFPALLKNCSTDSVDSDLIAYAHLCYGLSLDEVAGDQLKAEIEFNNLTKNWPNSNSAGIAKILLASNKQNLSDSTLKSLYLSVLSNYKNLSEPWTDWLKLKLLEIVYREDNQDETVKYLSNALTFSLVDEVATSAMLYSVAASHPNSVEANIILYSNASQIKYSIGGRQTSWKLFRRFLDWTNTEAYSDYMTDSLVADADKASMLYRVAIAKWECGEHDDICNICDTILTDYNPDSELRKKCLYTKAYHHIHCGDFSGGAELLSRALQSRNGFSEYTPEVYMLLIRAYEMNKDDMKASRAAKEFVDNYPWRAECSHMNNIVKRLGI